MPRFRDIAHTSPCYSDIAHRKGDLSS